MYTVGLFDGSFAHQRSMSMGGENFNEAPSRMLWAKDRILPVTVFTDMLLNSYIKAPDYLTRIGLLIEPNSLSDTHYKEAMRLKDYFDCILTFNRDFVESDNSFMYYPIGGSWIKAGDCKIGNKTKDVSIISSFKTGAVGHRLRHKIVEMFFADKMDSVFGSGYKKIESKVLALSDYRYSVVVESCQLRGYFTEKVVDCISMGTIPIYWGASDIGDHFDRRGLLQFNSIDELEHILYEEATQVGYQERLPYVQKNYDLSWNYRCAEDWIISNYQFLFEQCENLSM